MDIEKYVRQGLDFQGIPFHETDIYYIHHVLFTINQAQEALQAFHDLYQEIPITIFDKGVLFDD